jgi:hypothetical protein
MTRWFSKRWVWAALAAATVTVGMAAGRGDGDGPPKVGTTISLNIDGKGERQFKVIKSEKQPDGSYLSELKDTKSGETITLVDQPGNTPPAPSKDAPRLPEPPKAKPRPNDAPPFPNTVPEPPKDKEKEKRPILGRIFGDKDKDKTPAMPSTSSSMPKVEVGADTGKKPGLLSRVFGPKKPTGPSMPATGPVVKPSSSTPPPIISLPPGGLSGAVMPPFPSTGSAPAFPGTSGEPPRVMPSKPVTPAPMTPAPVTPAPAPSFPTPAPLPLPLPAPPVGAATPTPTLPAPLPIPSVPLPSGPSVPPLPIPSGGTSSARPIQVVVPAGYIPAGVAFDREVQPFVIALQSMTAPSARLTAAQGLAEGRHCSTEGVKKVLFQAAQMDPCGEVRAACITHLCKLGYFDAQFLGLIQTACGDPDQHVREAAKDACAKMIRK